RLPARRADRRQRHPDRRPVLGRGQPGVPLQADRDDRDRAIPRRWQCLRHQLPEPRQAGVPGRGHRCAVLYRPGAAPLRHRRAPPSAQRRPALPDICQPGAGFLMRRAGKIALWTVGGLAGVIAVGFAFLQTGAGKGWVAATLSNSLSTPGSTITVGTIQGLVPFDISVDRIALGDAGGPWLTID